MIHLLWKAVCQLLKNLNLYLSYDPAIPVLGFYPREMKAYNRTKTYTQMFIAALFVIAQTGNNLKSMKW